MIYGKKDDNNNNLLLIVSWKNVIYFYQLKKDNKNMISNYIEIGNYINGKDILRIGFMNKSVIYCIDDTFHIKTLDSSKINTEKIELRKDKEEPIVPKKNNYIEIERNRFITKSFFFQKKNKRF